MKGSKGQLRKLFIVLHCASWLVVLSAQTSGGALFDEVWQTINDAYYDPTFGGLNWAAVRDELRPKAAATSSIGETHEVINEMLGRLGRSHFALLPAGGSTSEFALGGEANVGIDIRPYLGRVIITRVEPNSPAQKAGLRMGQVILAIDGQPLVPGPTPLSDYRRAFARLHGYDGSTAAIRVRLLDEPEQTISVRRTVEAGERVRFSNLPPLLVKVEKHEEKLPGGRRAGVIGFNVWMAQVNEPVAAAVDQFRSADGLVFDLRGNPGGLAGMIMGLAGQILDTPALLGTMRTRQVPKLEFVANPRRSTLDGRSVKPFAGPVAVLVDEMSASASECFAGGLQDLGRVRVFGRTSMGAALPASTKRLSNGDVLEYVVGDFVTSKGRSLEGTGVVPDEVQPLSAEALWRGEDATLKAALTWIDKTGRTSKTPGLDNVRR
jgi:carboxyl-terminal processing protease